MIQPFRDIQAINALFNDPRWAHWTLMGAVTWLDAEEWVRSGQGIFLGDERGGFLNVNEGDGIWSFHTAFMPEARGQRVGILGMQAASWMFRNTDCIALRTFIETQNRHSRALGEALGFISTGEGVIFERPGSWYVLDIKQWARNL